MVDSLYPIVSNNSKKMSRNLILLVLIILLLSCKNECSKYILGKETEDKYVLNQENTFSDCDDKKTFYHKAFYHNDTLAHEVMIVNDEKHGYYKSFYFDGTPKYEGNYYKGRKEGKWIYRKKESYHEKEYINDTLNGSVKEIHDDGTIVYGNYENGLESGLWIWIRNGALDQVVNYKNGKYDGLGFGVFSNGQIRSRNYFDMDSVISEVEYWDKSGTRIDEEEYKRRYE
jgi:antitoxin component YwqK of YwqJK toxin-antitoxin module